jgi:Cu2+-exporting ATPase
MLDKWRKKDTQEEQAASEVFLTLHKQSGEVLIMARFVIKDALRDNISELINALKQQGLQVHLLSGDRHPAVEAVADELKISNIIAMASPSEKQAYVRNLQASERVVLMVGDGINDAPVLASADVSMAAGDATALARTAADVISLLPGLNGLLQLLKKATQTKNIVRQNLTWAASYNALAIPLAGLGLIPPWAAAIGMALSSLLVAANAQRLWSKRLEISGSIGTTAIPN